jgi:hypothetical protein
MRPGRAVIAVVVSGLAFGMFGWNASREVESQEQVVGTAGVSADKYNPAEAGVGGAVMRRTVQRMIIR